MSKFLGIISKGGIISIVATPVLPRAGGWVSCLSFDALG